MKKILGVSFMKIYFEQSGGFTGIENNNILINSNSLDTEEASELQRLVDNANFFDLPSDPAAPLHGADYLEYKITIETNSCVKSIEANPRLAHIFVASTYIGEIMLIDLSQKDQIQCTSKVDSYFHKECIIAIKWINFNTDENYVKMSLKKIYFF